MKRILTILLAVLMIAAVLAACGEDKSKEADSTEPVAAVGKTDETTTVIGSTADGGTLEQDEEGNVVEKDSAGTIVSVTDKSGNTVSVSEYSAAHPAIASGAQSAAAQGDSKTDAAQPAETKAQEQPTDTASATESGDTVEDEIPTIVIDIPDSGDEYELPLV